MPEGRSSPLLTKPQKSVLYTVFAVSMNGCLDLPVVEESGDPLNVLRIWPDDNRGQLKAIQPACE